MTFLPSADRQAPPDVPPLTRDGVTYAQADDGRALGHDQVGGVLEARDAATGGRLWTLAVYPNAIDPDFEEDVQWRFFRSMAWADDGRLRVVDEAGGQWLVDVRARTSTPAS